MEEIADISTYQCAFSINSNLEGSTIFISSDLEEFLNLLRSNADPDILSKYLEVLKKLVESDDNLNDNTLVNINECIQIVTPFISNKTSISSQIVGLYLEFLILLLFIKLNLVKEDHIEHNNTTLTIINNGIKLVKLCNQQEFYLKAEYYSNKLKILIDMLLKEYWGKEGFSPKKMFLEIKITLDMYYIETLSNSGKLYESFDEILNLKHGLTDFPNHQEYFFRLCYNTGVKFLRKEEYEYAIAILETAQGISNDADVSSNVEISRLLSHVYLQHNPEQNWQKCMKVLNSAQNRNPQSNFIPNLLQAAFFSNNESLLKETLKSSAESDIPMALILKVTEDLQNNGYMHLVTEFVKKVRVKRSEVEEKLYLISVELQIHFKINSLERANVLIDDAIKMIKLQNLNPTKVHCLCKVVSTYAADKFKAKSFVESLNWYKKCSRLLEATNGRDVTAFQYLKQRICLCHIQLNEIDLAKQALIGLDILTDGTDPFYVYLALQISVMSEDEKFAEVTLKSIRSDDQRIERILLSCCKSALLAGKKEFLCKILELVLQRSGHEEKGLLRVKVCQSLVRLHLDTAENNGTLEKILTFMEEASQTLQRKQETERQADFIEMAEWFSHAAWNLVLKPGVEAYPLFRLAVLCCYFLEMARGASSRLKNAFVLMAAAGLQCLKSGSKEKENDAQNKEDIIRKVLTAVQKSRNLESSTNSSLVSLLYLYEFETRTYLGDSSAELTLKQMLHAPCVNAKTLETAAAIAYEQSSNNYKMITQALNGAITKAMEGQSVNCYELSKLYHSLVQMRFFTQEFLNPATEDENFTLCENLLKLLEGDDFQEYPQIEVLWLMTKCWNWGVHRLASGDAPTGREWCSLALGYMHLLKELKTLHEKKLRALFAAYFGPS